MTPDTPLFPELDIERARLQFSRQCRDRMIDRLSAVDPEGAADLITKEYIEVTVAEALGDLRTAGAGDFFGRIDTEATPRSPSERWYVGRRHIEDANHDPVVVDWRAPIAAPFYRATAVDALGLSFRRRFTLAVDADGVNNLSAYLDEQLDDPDSASAASGIPDPVLAEIGAARTGAMREIVATIQAEQDVVIRAPIDQCLVVQGGPGTGKTAVGLHRAAYLLFEHRRRLAREGVLVVGPNRVFLDYIGHVLPSLGERSVRQATVIDLCVPRVDVSHTDSIELARLKGSERMLAVLANAAVAAIKSPSETVRVPNGARSVVFTADEITGWISEVLGDGAGMGLGINRRKEALRNIAQRELLRRTGKDEAWANAGVLRSALTKAWPSQNPQSVVRRLLTNAEVLGHAGAGLLTDDEQRALIEAATRRPGRGEPKAATRWTAADQLLIDEMNSLLNSPPFVYGHVVVDEAQDHSAVALKAIGRRSPTGSLTILGDLAQSTTPAGQSSWDVVLRFLNAEAATVAHLTIGYRVPAPILDIANRLLPMTAVDTVASRSVRLDGTSPTTRLTTAATLAAGVAEEVVAMRHRHPLTGVIAPEPVFAAIAAALAAVGLVAVDRVQDLAKADVPLFGAESVKGLEFDGVIVVNPHQMLDGSARGARLLYVAMTRAVQTLRFVTDQPLPAVLDAEDDSGVLDR
jgi:DNA helicase IV